MYRVTLFFVQGTVVRSEVVGALKMRTFLSGMPECKLGLNDKVLTSLVVFDCAHPCELGGLHRIRLFTLHWNASCVKNSFNYFKVALL